MLPLLRRGQIIPHLVLPSQAIMRGLHHQPWNSRRNPDADEIAEPLEDMGR
jgi:hypothetical protein